MDMSSPRTFIALCCVTSTLVAIKDRYGATKHVVPDEWETL